MNPFSDATTKRPTQYFCDQCDLTTSTNIELYKHKESSHGFGSLLGTTIILTNPNEKNGTVIDHSKSTPSGVPGLTVNKAVSNPVNPASSTIYCTFDPLAVKQIEFPCNLCDYKAFNGTILKMHLDCHKKEKIKRLMAEISESNKKRMKRADTSQQLTGSGDLVHGDCDLETKIDIVEMKTESADLKEFL